MRDVNHIVLHCTATSQKVGIESIKRYWRTVMKWKSPGYHYIITPNGLIVQLHPIEKPSNGVAGHNHDSIHISYIGGIDKHGNAIDNRTNAQKQAQIDLIKRIRTLYPYADIVGHRDFLERGKPGWKECPSYDAKEWCACVGLESSPINTNI